MDLLVSKGFHSLIYFQKTTRFCILVLSLDVAQIVGQLALHHTQPSLSTWMCGEKSNLNHILLKFD